MKVAQLLEGDLGELASILLLVKHTGMSRSKAEELAKRLKEFKFYVAHKYVPANLRWVEDQNTGTLKFISADMPGSWRSGAAALGRYQVIELLQNYGFSVARFALDAVKRRHLTNNGPHIFFWGSRTPPPSKKQLEKVWGTDEHREASITKHSKQAEPS